MLHRSITASLFLMLFLGLTLFTSGIAEAQNPPQNNAPTPVGTIPNQTLTLGGTDTTVNLAPHFNDADGDDLTYTAVSGDETIVTVSVSGASLTITAVAAGTATITVTATDTSSATATQDISVTVTSPNRAPTAVGTISDQALTKTGNTGGTATVDVSSNFSDPR